MSGTDPISLRRARGPQQVPGWVVALLVGGLAIALAATPGSLLDKADMVGYAVCHRIGERSFTFAGRQLPLCARCTGTFIGALVGFIGHAGVLRRRRASEFPPTPVMLLLGSLTLMWAADGLNSYMTLIGGPHLYEPHNWLRLTTGALQGLVMSAVVYPVFNFTVWRTPAPERSLRGPRDLGVLLLLEAGLIGVVLTGWPILLYPLALLSALGVLVLLTSVNTLLLLIVLRWDNTLDTWQESLFPLLLGGLISLVEVGLIDLLRYALTGSWQGGLPV